MNSETPNPITNAVIIYEKPPSGAFEEMLFGSDRENTLWVRFSDEDGAVEWIGKFACALDSSTVMRVTKVVEPDRFMITAGGAAYLVDATRRILLNQCCEPFVQDIAYDAEKNHFITGSVRLNIIEEGRTIWSSKRISLDGIYDMIVEGRILSGMAVVDYEAGLEPFAFNLDSREFIYSPDFSRWDAPVVPAKTKPWPAWVRKSLWFLIPFYIIALGGMLPFMTGGAFLLYGLAVITGTIALHRFLKRKRSGQSKR